MIEAPVLLNLHESITIPGLLANAESWNLSQGETTELEKIEIQALKHLFDLPNHQPTPSIIYSFGTIFTKFRVEQKRLIYLHRILKRTDAHWTNQVLMTLENKNLGWCKSIKETLRQLDLPTNFSEIKTITIRQWERIIKQKIENANTQRLINECHKINDGKKVEKYKTAHILQHLKDNNYVRQSTQELLSCSKQETKTLMIARFRMLECGTNYKGSKSEICSTCKRKDDENHRLNECKKYVSNNYHDSDDKLPFDLIYSQDLKQLRKIISRIENVWNTSNAHGTMRN